MSGYPNELKYYMWGYQVHFRISCQTRAELVFNHFDRGLLPKVFLLGFPKDELANFDNICYEDESLDYLALELIDIYKKIREYEKTDPDNNLFYTGPGMQEEMADRRRNNWFRKAISDSLNNSKYGSKSIFFVAPKVLIKEHHVFIALSLNREIYESHMNLKINKFAERYRIVRSVIEAAVDNFLSDCNMELQLPAPGKDLGSKIRGSEDIIRTSASDFILSVASKGHNGQGLHSLFMACNKISIHRYEGKENEGQVFITDKKNPHFEFTMELEEPFLLYDYRKTRKLLQLTGGVIGLITDSYEVLGLGKIKESYIPASESIFMIKFNGIHCWEVLHNNQTLLIMRYGEPYLPHEIISKTNFMSDCKRLFKVISDNQIKNLYQLAVAATKQKNGAMLIISGDPATEAKRLSKHCIAIKLNQLDEERLISMTSIDGGLLVDIDGNAHAQGVILDGIVGNKGDSSRGSRYNSAITYCDFKGKEIPTLIIVVSEDGMVDVIPHLMPQINRSDIPDMLSLLHKATDENDVKSFNEIMYWLKSRQFYLSKEQCDEINEVKRGMENRDFENLRIIHEELFPNPEMNDSYFV